MSRMTKFKRWLAGTAVKAMGLSLVPRWVRSTFLEPAFYRLVSVGYKGNATAYACFSILARTFPEPELWPYVTKQGQETKPDNHKLRQLMRKPNPDMGEAELLMYSVIYCALGGNIYLWKQRNGAGQVIALWPFHDGYMSPLPGRNTDEGIVRAYWLDLGDGTGVEIDKSEIVHWKWMPDPEQPSRGMGALAASFSDLQIAGEVNEYIYSLLKNDAKPPVVVTMAEGDEYDEDLADRLREQWVEKFGGANRGLPAFLPFGMDVKELGFSLQQLEIDSLRNGPDAAICMGFGIHPAVVGAMVGLENSTYSNYEEASRALTLQTLVPLWRSFASEIQQAFENEPGYKQDAIRLDISTVRALMENQEMLRAFALNAFNAGGITRGEFRQMVGQPVRADDEVYKLAINTILEPAGRALPNGGQKALPVMLDQQVMIERMIDEKLAKMWNGRNGYHDSDSYTVIYPLQIEKQFNEGNDGAGTRRANRDDYQRQLRAVIAMREIKDKLAPIATDLVTPFFDAYGQQAAAVLRAERSLPATNGHVATKELKVLTPADIDQLLTLLYDQFAQEELENIIAEIRYMACEESWETLNLIIGATVQFDANDPAVVEVLSRAGSQVKYIAEATRNQLQTHLQMAYEEGWSIQDIARGRDGRPGIADFVAETYKGRPENIARTELGMAQNGVAAGRFHQAGADGVIVYDGGTETSDEDCNALDGTIQTLDWAAENPLAHPRCIRAFGAWFDPNRE